MNSKVSDLLKSLLPPIALRMGRRLAQKKNKNSWLEWEYMPQGWPSSFTKNIWNEKSIVELMGTSWSTFISNLRGIGTGPLTMNHGLHNILMSFAYVLMLTASGKSSLSVLDWGSSTGYYYLLSRELLPNVHIEYHCYDVPLACQFGRKLFPEVRFCDITEDIFQRQYDLVLTSDSLQYFKDWSGVARKLSTSTRSFLYIAQLPIVRRVPSFVVEQRIENRGCNFKCPVHFLNRGEFLKCIEEAGLELAREFIFNEYMLVHKAPEKEEVMGFLFRRRK